MKEDNHTVDLSAYRIVGGSLNSSWTTEHLDGRQQSEVRAVHLGVNYGAHSRDFQDDIAVVHLGTEFIFSPVVRAVCLDLMDRELHDSQTSPGTVGKVAGWGVTQSGTLSNLLNFLRVPIVDKTQCYRQMPYSFRRQVTSDKICAGLTNGSVMCPGDSGGGLVFPLQDTITGLPRWYLRAVLSNAPRSQDPLNVVCQTTYATLYTNIFPHRTWLSTNMEKLQPQKRCRARGSAGSCEEFTSCPAAIEDASRGILPLNCSPSSSNICCLETNIPVETNCPPLPPSIVSQQKTGSKAQDFPVIPETRGDFKPIEVATTVNPEMARLPAPTVNDNCAYGSGATKSGNLIDGLRFGSQPDSRVEFDKLPARYKNSDFSVEFNTTSDGGVIFYAADRSHKDFVTLFMRDGKIHFGYNCGTGPARLVSPRTYNDGQWHSVSFSQEGINGKLTVDEELVAEGKSQGSSTTIIMQGPFFLGGLANVSVEIKYNLEDYYSPFHGCVRNFAMCGQPLSNIKTQVGALSCLQKFEDGIYFGGNGYLKLLQNFKVGVQLEISMEIKTRQTSGILLSIHGRKDFLILEIFNNTIMARVDNGEGPFQASYKLSNQYLLCDGNWHTIQILKSKYVVSVAVDKHFSDPGVGSGPTTNTKSSIFIGGHPYSSRIRGSRSLTDFTGCMRNLKIRGQTVDIPENRAHGSVRIGACPAD